MVVYIGSPVNFTFRCVILTSVECKLHKPKNQGVNAIIINNYKIIETICCFIAPLYLCCAPLNAKLITIRTMVNTIVSITSQEQEVDHSEIRALRIISRIICLVCVTIFYKDNTHSEVYGLRRSIFIQHRIIGTEQIFRLSEVSGFQRFRLKEVSLYSNNFIINILPKGTSIKTQRLVSRARNIPVHENNTLNTYHSANVCCVCVCFVFVSVCIYIEALASNKKYN